MREFYASAIRTANERKKLFEKLMSTNCFRITLSSEDLDDPVVKAMFMRAQAMGGGFDIMKQVVEKTRTKKKKNQNKQYYTDGYNIMRKWQRKDTGRPFKKTVPIKEDFSIMRQIQEHPVSIKKEKKKSLMEPIEVDYPPTVYVRRKS